MVKRIALLATGVVLALAMTVPALAGNSNGSAGDMPALYDGQQFTINFKEEPGGAEAALLAHAIQGDGFNPLWQEVQITFNSGFTPRQLTSDTAIEAAADAGEITLTPTDEVYRCSVVGTKK